uniref:Uncharacterized protein n=1 Tax=Strongyloides venezuelensis TaxID=75913 RepID=A0A0K0FGV0_STRVS
MSSYMNGYSLIYESWSLMLFFICYTFLINKCSSNKGPIKKSEHHDSSLMPKQLVQSTFTGGTDKGKKRAQKKAKTILCKSKIVDNSKCASDAKKTLQSNKTSKADQEKDTCSGNVAQVRVNVVNVNEKSCLQKTKKGFTIILNEITPNEWDDHTQQPTKIIPLKPVQSKKPLLSAPIKKAKSHLNNEGTSVMNGKSVSNKIEVQEDKKGDKEDDNEDVADAIDDHGNPKYAKLADIQDESILRELESGMNQSNSSHSVCPTQIIDINNKKVSL